MKIDYFIYDDVTLDSSEMISEYYVKISDDEAAENKFLTALNLYIYDCIEKIAAFHKDHPHEDIFPYDEEGSCDFSDYFYEILDYTEFIYEEEFDREVTKYDLEDCYENAIKIFKHPITGQLYALPLIYSYHAGNDWSVNDFYYATPVEKTIISYNVDYGT